MGNNYTIQIRKNNTSLNEPAYSAYCKEWDITADHDTISEVLSTLSDAINFLESEKALK